MPVGPKKSKRQTEHTHSGVQRQKRSDRLSAQLEQGAFREAKVIAAPPGEVKMSQVLGEFVAPYGDFAETEEAYRSFLTLAILAWNAACLPSAEQETLIAQAVSRGAPKGDKKLRAELRGIIDELVRRKKRRFAQYTRMIVAFDLVDTGDAYQVTVLSTWPEQRERKVWPLAQDPGGQETR